MHTHSAEELRAFAAHFIQELAPSAVGATIVALSGDLGAGKTCFTQGAAAALGVAEQVASPTFVIEKIYPLAGQEWKRLIHIDAYRLKSAQELSVVHWDELLTDSGNLILIEWPEQVPGAIPTGAIRIHFAIEGDGRIITIDGQENGEKNSKKEAR